MASPDSKAPFLQLPWAAALLAKPNTICRVPGSRKTKGNTEDSLFAEVLKSPRSIRSCISIYQKPSDTEARIGEVTTLMTLGEGMNGHPHIMHGGIVATILDESMGVLQSANLERNHMLAVGLGLADGETPAQGLGSFTVELKVKYLKPVRTPGSLMCVARYVRREGRKEWIYAEVRQWVEHGEDDYGEEVVCATGEAVFVEPRSRL